MTCNVFSETLNTTQSINLTLSFQLVMNLLRRDMSVDYTATLYILSK